jgi:two-component system, response regulator RpfG
MHSIHTFNTCSVLILDDQTTSRTILSHVIKNINANIKVTEKSSPEDALEWATQHPADLVLVDYVMPEMNGVDFVRLLKTIAGYEFVPVMMITIKKDAETRNNALDAGVTDFLSKPIDVHECTARSINMLTMRQQHLSLTAKSELLEQMVRAATQEIRNREKETIMRLARAGEYKDFDTAKHLQRMAQYSRAIADAIGLSEEDAEMIELAAPLHDIGKLGIPDDILNKKSALDTEQLAVMRRHPNIGYQMLQDSPSKYLQMGAEIALAHHERFDGKGYPNGLSGEQIPLCARIVSIADVFDALTSKRPYKEAWSTDRAIAYILEESDKHFDPQLVSALLKIRPKLEKILQENATPLH